MERNPYVEGLPMYRLAMIMLATFTANPVRADDPVAAREPKRAFPQIVFVGTDKFHEAVSAFTVSPADAMKVLKREMEDGRIEKRGLACRFVVNRFYVFSPIKSKSDLVIYGLYVDGDSGLVREFQYDERDSVYGELLKNAGLTLPRHLADAAGYRGEKLIVEGP